MYKKSELLRTLITFNGKNIDKDYEKYSEVKEDVKVNKEKYKEETDFYEIVKEMIFDIDKEDKPLLYIICYSFNSSYNSLELSALLKTSVEAPKNKIEKDIRYELAMSIIYNIPVFANDSNVEQKLVEYYSQLYKYGFELLDKNEEMKTYKLSDFLIPKFEESTIEHSQNNFPRIYSSGEMTLYKSRMMERLKELDNAQYLINNLNLGIRELSILLKNTKRNENDLQRCLTSFPILFGTEYVKILDKHTFGSEFEADYVLERSNGLYDIVEIESSNLRLYTKQGNPKSELVHAEQQIMDWLEWIEHNSPYAREKIKNLYTPKGFVVIGRSNSLSPENKEKLRRRNLIFRDKIEIITYDDLLAKANSLLSILVGNKKIKVDK